MTSDILALEDRLKKIIIGFLLAVFVLGGAVMRFDGLGEYFFSSDDALHIAVARADTFTEFWNNVKNGDVHAPLHPFLIFLALKISDNEIFLRSIAIIPSLILILVLYFVGRERGGRSGGLLVAFFGATSFALISVSQTIRDYSWFLLLISLALYFFGRYRSRGNRRDLTWYALTAGVAMLFSYTAVFVIAGIGISYGVRLWSLREYQKLRLWTQMHIFLAFAGFLLFISRFPAYAVPIAISVKLHIYLVVFSQSGVSLARSVYLNYKLSHEDQLGQLRLCLLT